MYHKRNTHESTASRNSLDEDAKLQNLATEFQEHSSDDVKSFVIINDIDVDEELSKAQKDNKNFFQVLSMNFYGKIRSHSVDNREFRNQEKSQFSIKSDLKSTVSTISRKGSCHSLLEKTSSTIKEAKQKPTIGLVKKNNLPVKGLEIVTEKLSKNLASPKESPRKVFSPKATAKKSPVTGNLTAKASNKREPLFFLEVNHQKPQILKKKSGDRVTTSPDRKVSPIEQSTPHMGKKTSLSKLLKHSEKTPENIEDIVQTLNVEPSTLEIKPLEYDEPGSERHALTLTEEKLARKISSRVGSDKIIKDKSLLSSHSARILTSTGKSQSKIVLKELQKYGHEGKLAKLESVDQLDLEADQDKKGRTAGSTKNQVFKVKQNRDGQKSPESTKKAERVFKVAATDTKVAENQGMKIIIANKDSTVFKELRKSQSKEINSSGAKSKKNSTGRLDRIDLMGSGKEKKLDEVFPSRQAKTPKFDGIKTEGDKYWKVFDISDKMIKEKKDKYQPTSPASGEARKVLHFFDKLASLKKREKL